MLHLNNIKCIAKKIRLSEYGKEKLQPEIQSSVASNNSKNIY